MVRVSDRGNVLNAVGIHFDTVAFTSPPVCVQRFSDIERTGILDRLERIATGWQSDGRVEGLEDRQHMEPFSSIVSLGCFSHDETEFQDFCKRYWRWRKGQAEPEEGNRTCREVFFAIMNRVIYKTVNGLLGLGPLAAQPGDVVVVLLGCQVPLLLRPRVKCTLVGQGSYRGPDHGSLNSSQAFPDSSSSNTGIDGYTVIGESCQLPSQHSMPKDFTDLIADIQGVMNGEILASFEEGETELEEFQIH